ncbi:MAG: FliH/SctL family protein [Pseudomonadota bacterium]
MVFNPKVSQLLGTTRIVAPEDVPSLKDLASRIEQAKTGIIEQAATSEERIQQQMTAGYTEGYEDGLSNAMNDAMNVLVNLKHRLTIEHDQICNVVTDAIGKLLDEPPAQVVTPQLVQAAVNQVADSTTSLTVEVCPELVDTVKKQLGDLEDTHVVHVEPDPAMEPTDCRIRTAVGIIEAGLDTQLHALTQALKATVSETT